MRAPDKRTRLLDALLERPEFIEAGPANGRSCCCGVEPLALEHGDVPDESYQLGIRASVASNARAGLAWLYRES